MSKIPDHCKHFCDIVSSGMAPEERENKTTVKYLSEKCNCVHLGCVFVVYSRI